MRPHGRAEATKPRADRKSADEIPPSWMQAPSARRREIGRNMNAWIPSPFIRGRREVPGRDLTQPLPDGVELASQRGVDIHGWTRAAGITTVNSVRRRGRFRRPGGLAHTHAHGLPLCLDEQHFVSVLVQAGRGLTGKLPAAEQEVRPPARRQAAQFVACLDVVERTAVGGQIDALSVFFSAAAATAGMEALRSSWRSMFWQSAAASAVHRSSSWLSAL